MIIGEIEMYPYKGKVYKRYMPLDNLSYKNNIIEYSNEKYIELFEDNCNVNQIITNVLIECIRISDSNGGFISTVKNTDTYYACIYNKNKRICVDSINDKVLPIDSTNLLTRAISKSCIIISNDVTKDPRFKNVQLFPDNSVIDTFTSIPFYHDNNIIGQICLVGSKKYRMKTAELLLPLTKFLKNVIYLKQSKKLLSNKELEIKKELVTLKDSFIATMSHEIRTPLNGIVGMTKLLSESNNLSDKQERYLNILAECSTQLMELVNDILDYSKMTATGITLYKQPFNLKNCIKNAVNIISPRATDKGLNLTVNIIEDLPENVTGDARRLKQVLFNLLTNSIKFTECGTIELIVTFESIDDNEWFYNKRKRIIFKIIDTGIGIKDTDKQKIFQVFTKLTKDDNFYTSTTPGAGMGLAISKYIVEGMEGKISVESDGINGSIFTFSIILDDDTDIQKILNTHSKDLQNKTAIIVDDNEDNRIFLMDSLYSWGIHTHSCSSAREALNYMSKRPFDIAIIDLCMPGMGGLELIQTMREKNFKQPVIGLSSIGEDISGKDWFDYFATKPVSKSHLFNLILKCFINNDNIVNKRTSNIISTGTRMCSKNMNIIIAEDDYYNQVVISELLQSLGYCNIKIVDNGKLCVEEITAKANNYIVCLMDVKMPIMDGLEATRQIKKLPNPPTIIAVSASVLDADKSQCFSAGMDGYIAKPIKKDQLEAVLKSLEKNT